MRTLKKWLLTASTQAQTKFCQHSRISIGYLRKLAHGERTASAEVAVRMERTARKFSIPITREDLCPACRKCELAKFARNSAP